MADSEKLIKFIVKLTRLTVEGRLNWVRSILPNSYSDFDFINPAFEVSLEGMRILLFSRFRNRESEAVLLLFDRLDEDHPSVLQGVPGLDILYDFVKKRGVNVDPSIESKIDSVLAL